MSLLRYNDFIRLNESFLTPKGLKERALRIPLMIKKIENSEPFTIEGNKMFVVTDVEDALRQIEEFKKTDISKAMIFTGRIDGVPGQRVSTSKFVKTKEHNKQPSINIVYGRKKKLCLYTMSIKNIKYFFVN